MKRQRSWWQLQARAAPYLFVLPFVLLFFAVQLYPLGRSLVISFYDTAGPRATRFVGLENYRYLLGDKLFWGALANTLYYAIAFLAVQIPASLGLALLLNSRKLKWRGFFRFAFFSTHLVGHVFVAVLFAALLSPRQGPVNELLSAILGRQVEIMWLTTPSLAMPAVLLAAWWLSIGYGMIYFLAALQAVDQSLYEAAEVDGAGRWAKFRHVTLPGIKPVLTFLIVVGMIGALQLFELPYVLFGGPGPNSRGVTVVMYLYLAGFELGNLGYASAVGWLLFVIIMGISIMQVRMMRMTRED